jgi:putative FmdB family regulatory protein
MPLYEYHCNDCGDEFEKTVRFADAESVQDCPACGSHQTHKKISRTAVIGGAAQGSQGGSSSARGCGSGGGFT